MRIFFFFLGRAGPNVKECAKEELLLLFMFMNASVVFLVQHFLVGSKRYVIHRHNDSVFID